MNVGDRVLVVAGPTASRKTELGLFLAERLGGEIVCADSVQLLEGFHVGSAAPTTAERMRAPHHLFNEFTPLAPPHAGDFVVAADAAIRGILARRRVPILVGGTGLYLRALLNGLAPMPPVPDDVRLALQAEYEARGIDALWRRLEGLDPVGAARIEGGARNTQRVLRALEVVTASGVALSTWQSQHTPEARYSAVHLVPLFPTAALGARIDVRVEAMFRGGFVDEVKALLDRGVPLEGRAMRTLGYAEIGAWLTSGGPLAPVIADVQRGHRQYARRQRTWFRKVDGARVLDPEAPDFLDQALLAASYV